MASSSFRPPSSRRSSTGSARLTPEPRPQTPDPTEQLALTVLAPAFGLPSLSPQCTHALVYLKLAGLTAPDDYHVVEASSAKLAPRMQLPLLSVGGLRSRAYSPELFDELRALGHDLDAALTLSARDRADMAAYHALIEDALAPALLHAWWLDAANYAAVTRTAHAACLPFPLSLYGPWQMQRRTHAYLARRGLGSATHAAALAARALDALAARLGTQPYFGGNSACSLDAHAFAYLATIHRCTLPSDGLQRALGAHPPLVQYVERLGAGHGLDERLGDATASEAVAHALERHSNLTVSGAAEPSDPAAAKRLRAKRRSRRFIAVAVGSWLAYVVVHLLPTVLAAIADGRSADDDDDDEDDDDDAD